MQTASLAGGLIETAEGLAVDTVPKELVDLATILYALRAQSGPPSDLRPSA